MIVLKTIFWIAIFGLLHSYIFYPFILRLWKQKHIDTSQFEFEDNDLPNVHILIAAYNEEAVIEQKLKSIYNTNYPKDKIFIWIGSDASTDNTEQIIRNTTDEKIVKELIVFGGRTGKPAIINQLFHNLNNSPYYTDNDTLIISDANVFFETNTIFELVKHFKNESIAMVGAIVKNIDNQESNIGKIEQIYIGGENKIKLLESEKTNAVIGLFGGCIAVRANQYFPTPEGFIADDFYLTLKNIQNNKKVIISEEAVVYEDLPDNMMIEFKRKRRISAGNFQNMFHFTDLWLFPLNKIKFAFFSHKILRWLGPILLCTIGIVNTIIYFLNQSYFHLIVLIATCALLLLMFLKLVTPDSMLFKLKPVNAIAYFLSMNLALLFGFLDYLKGIKTNTWERTERNVRSD